MIRLILSVIFFAASLLCVLPIPAKQLWYLAIAVGEFPWVTIILSLLLLIWVSRRRRYRVPAMLFALCAVALFSRPLFSAAIIAHHLDERLAGAFRVRTADLKAPHRQQPFSLTQMISGIGAKPVPFTNHQYAPGGDEHSLRFYPAALPGPRPCLVMVHGGSWKSGNNGELPNVNDYYARAGYAVASINYRLASQAKSPAPQEDVAMAFGWLKAHAATLNIDTTAFVLMGRSAGGQIVLTAAYTLHEPGLRGVVSFYGPTDMLFAWNDAHNQLVMRHRDVLTDFYGGSPDTLRQRYLDGSPARMVTAQTVPTLMVHGMLDQHVHFRESEILDSALQRAGVPHLLLGLPWATHGCEYSLNGPSGQLAVYSAERFMYAVTQGALRQ